jgi:glucose-6-phosphate 1-dehydrogenase
MAAARYVAGGYDDPDTYQRLAEVLDKCDRDAGTAGSRLYYFSTPPRLFSPIALSLGKAGLSQPTGDGFVRAVIEKPFGWDEESARELYVDLSTAFVEEQIFRIDHYLAKETVQNLLALRFANSIFEPIWNRTWVDNVQITVAETLGVGDRGGFYETTGRCGTSSRTTCCRCCPSSSWNRRRRSTPRPSGTRRSSCSAPSGRSTTSRTSRRTPSAASTPAGAPARI